MAKKKLKAFVRYDATGRIVAGSLILRAKQPAIGRFHEVTSDLCCPVGPPEEVVEEE